MYRTVFEKAKRQVIAGAAGATAWRRSGSSSSSSSSSRTRSISYLISGGGNRGVNKSGGGIINININMNGSSSSSNWKRGRYMFSSVPRKESVDNVIIMGAAGRDFHNFNMYFRGNPKYNVVAFTATQIPGIEGRNYPPKLSGSQYPKGIPIFPEEDLEKLIAEKKVNQVFFSYSDLAHVDVMHKASRSLAAGADFCFLGPWKTQLISSKPVVAVLASRTGCGKSQTSRQIVQRQSKKGKKVVAIRHPMPYGDLSKQICQRFAKYEDLEKHNCTIEEREEYEPYIDMGAVIYAGVDYKEILEQAEKEADLILWDGGNNDMAFIKPTVQVCVVDPHRAGHEMLYHPGETNVRNSDIILVNKIDTASMEQIWKCRENCRQLNPRATICDAASPIFVEEPELVTNRRVLVVEDGPTVTHGEMKVGAGFVAAKRLHCKTVVDPRPFAVNSIKETYTKYPHVTDVLPAMGYGHDQIKDLETTINRCDADVVVSGTPIDLGRIIKVNKPVIRARYELQAIGQPDIHDIIDKLLAERH